MKHGIIFLCIATLLCSCIHTKKLATKEVTLDSITVSAKRAGGIYRASAPRIWDITHTRVAMSFNMKEKTADGKAWIDLHPYFYPTDTLVLDAKSMHIDTVLLEQGEGRLLSYTYQGDSLKIRFSKAYQPADSIRLYIAYVAMPYSIPTGGSAAITEDRGLYFINTDNAVPGKPVQIWTQGETESNSRWLPTIDKPNERMTTEIALTVPDSFVTLSNGYLAKHYAYRNGMRTDIWKMAMPIQTYAIMFAIGKFAIVKDHWHGKDVNYYVEPAYAPYAAKMFNNTPEMIEHFSKITGVQYPWNKYDQVVVRDYVSGAMENTTASLFGEFMNQNFREIADRNYEDVVSHELFHQWFGDYVTCESWSNITLNESFADYGEQLWRRYKYGNISADKHYIESLNKYLGYVESSDNDKPLVRYYYDDREDVFDPISYEKGGAILKYLNGLMGDDAFDKSMNAYLTKNALHSAEAAQWRLAIEQVTGQDWNWFFNEFYYHGNHPVLNVTYLYNDSASQVRVIVQQTQPDSGFLYRLPLKAAIVTRNSHIIADWDVQHRADTFTYAYANGQRPLIIPDIAHWLPGKLTDNKTTGQWYEQYEYSNDYISKRKALSGAYLNKNDSLAKVIFQHAMTDTMNEVKEYALSLLYFMKDSDDFMKYYYNEVLSIATTDNDRIARADAIKLLGKWEIRSAKDLMTTAVKDSSYMIAGAALISLDAIDAAAAYKTAIRLLPTHPEAELMAAIWKVIGKKGAADDIALFEQEQYYVYGTKKFAFVTGLYIYLENVKSDSSFRRGLQIMLNITNNENIKSYRRELGAILFELAGEYKKRGAAKDTESYETIRAFERMPVINNYLQQLMNDETDEAVKKDYKTLYDELNAEAREKGPTKQQ